MAASLATKLKIRPGSRVLIVGAPDDYLEQLQPLPAGASVSRQPNGEFDVVQLFSRDLPGLLRDLRRIKASVATGGVLWVSYPKLTSSLAGELSRDRIFESVQSEGVIPVTQVAVDDDWSALWLRPIDAVGQKR